MIKSYLLNGEKKIGYISLPDFYTEWESVNPLGCANDVAKEILKLRKENIQGLILDLRYNGGGSMTEALELAGIFIDEGALGILAVKNEKPVTLKDMNRGTIYDGPLVLMVNNLSASASELVAACLQDHNRAVVTGSATYGKATAQVILPLDTTLDFSRPPSSPAKNNLGFAKVTVNRFYRVTGKSHQQKGVYPDVLLPDLLEAYPYQEVHKPYALPCDSVNKKVYFAPFPPIPVLRLSEQSALRLGTHDGFRKIKSMSDSLKRAWDQPRPVSLNLETFRKKEKKSYELMSTLDSLGIRNASAYQAAHNLYDMELLAADPFRKEINDELLKKIQTDIYIEEAYHIITDLIKFVKP